MMRKGASIDQLLKRVDDRTSECSSVNEVKECDREKSRVKKREGRSLGLCA